MAGREYPTYDGMRAAEVTFENVTINPESVIGVLDNGYPLLEAVIDRGIAAVCAEAVGCMDALNAATLEYLKTRQQFGVPIGKFQALQHRMVDMLIHVRAGQVHGAAGRGARSIRRTPPERRRCVSAAKEFIGRAGRFVGQQAIQLHGGMGVTDELNVGHYVKRLTAIDTTFGDADLHLDRFCAGVVAPAEAAAAAARQEMEAAGLAARGWFGLTLAALVAVLAGCGPEQSPDEQLIRAVRQKDLPEVERLLAAGANPNADKVPGFEGRPRCSMRPSSATRTSPRS